MREIQVREVFDPRRMDAAIVKEDESLKNIIALLARNPRLRGVFVVDPVKRFNGVITRHDLLKWAHLRLGTETGAISVSPKDIYRMASATKARDLAQGNWQSLGVRLTDDLGAALRQILENDEIDIPVLDDRGGILGDLKLSQILMFTIEKGRVAEA